jgi:hypothetical protein
MIDIPLNKLTGFNLSEPPLQGHIRNLIDSIDGQNGFKLSFLFLLHGERNYDALNFMKDDKFHSFFIHRYFPIISRPIISQSLFDRSKPMQVIFEYQEVPQEIKQLIEPRYSCMSADYLNRPIQKEDLNDFDETLLKMVNHFKPQTIGDVMFNYWN